MSLIDPSPEFVIRLDKDLRAAAKTLSKEEARYLVDLYYTMQENRKSTGNAIGAIERQAKKEGKEEPNSLLTHFYNQERATEAQINYSLDKFSKSSEWGKWVRSVHGLGPVITAGFMAHFNIEKAPTAGHMLRFAGQDPTIVWEKGTKRRFNARLKVLCFHTGTGFIKFRSHKNDDYGKLFDVRKNYEHTRNMNGELKDQALNILTTKNFDKSKPTYKYYKEGILPPAHINSRVRRWMVRIFLSHMHDTGYYFQYGIAAPRPYSNEYLEHAHVVEPPHMDAFNGLAKAIRGRSPTVTIEKYYEMMANRWGVYVPAKGEPEEEDSED
jgi:hypothetical protein